MPAPASTAELNDVILKSGVIDEPKLRAYLGKLSDPPTDPSQLAGLMVRDGILTYFQAEQLLQGKWKRFFIGKYKVLEKLGAGGMGQVFLCEHKLMKRRVAVKVLPAAKAQDPAALSRFYREARAVAALDHPNIVRAYDIDEDGGLHFLVMEFVDGSNLHDLVKKFGPMDPIRASHYIYGSAVGLHHAAEMGLIHRDIKPANILVDRAGVVKILDMGLARFFDPDEDDMLTKKFDENVLGTADFLAPEQAIDSHNLDIRADIYGLGGTFYFLLTGQPPFLEGTVAQKLLWHQTKEPKGVRELRPDVPPELAAIIAKMMAKNPADRFQTPAELMAVLGPWVQTPIGAPTADEMPRFSAAAVGAPRGSGAPLVTGGSRTATAQPPAYTPAPQPPAYTPAPAALAPPPPLQLPDHWGEPAPADTLATARADTEEPVAPRKRKAKAPAKGAAGSGTLFIVLGIGLLLLGGVTAALLVWKPWASDTATPPDDRKPTPQPPATARWYVTAGEHSPNKDTTRKTLAEAVKAARSGETVVLLDDRIEGPAVLIPTTLKNLRIEAGNAAKSVVWSYKPDGATAQPGVLTVRGGGGGGIAVEGITIEANGAHDVGVHLSGFCDGVVLERVTVKGAKASAFHLLNVDASAKPLQLNRCRATGVPVGVLLTTGAKLSNKGIVLDGCRFDGVETAIQIDGACEAVAVRNGRLFGAARGVLLAGGLPAPDRVQLTIERNTFHSMREAAVKVNAALGGVKQEVTLSRNFFAATPAAMAGPNANVKVSDNARDEASKDGTLPLKATEIKGVSLPTDANADATFLRAPGKLNNVGAE